MSKLVQANQALRDKQFAKAVSLYLEILQANPTLSKMISGSLKIAQKRFQAERGSIQFLRVAVCGWELSHEAAGRVYTLAQLYDNFTKVEIIGSHFPSWGRQIWQPIKGIDIPVHSFVVEKEAHFINQAIKLVAEHPYDLVHLCKPRFPNILFGLLYKQIWGAQVLMDIDEEELYFVDAQTPIYIDDYLRQHEVHFKLENLLGIDWTRIAVGLAGAFDGVTVANYSLQTTYGGHIVCHACNEDKYRNDSLIKQNTRRQFNINPEKKVVLFLDTPRNLKGMVETAKALSSLKRTDIVYIIVGDVQADDLEEQLEDISGVEYVFIKKQSIGVLPGIIAMADVSVLFRNVDSVVAKYQTPAILSEALGIGLPVLASQIDALADLFLDGALLAVNRDNLSQQLVKVLDDTKTANCLCEAGHTYFMRELSFNANVPRLQKAIVETVCHPLDQGIEKLARQIENKLLSQLMENAKFEQNTISEFQYKFKLHADVPFEGWDWTSLPFHNVNGKTLFFSAEKLFDPIFYSDRNPDLHIDKKDLYKHFCLYGWRERRDPNPFFSIEKYLDLNPEVQDSDINPLFHYVATGGRRDIGGIFDVQYYEKQKPDVFNCDMLPLEHFVFIGLHEGIKPSRGVDLFSFLTSKEMTLSPWTLARLLVERIQSLINGIELIETQTSEKPVLSIIVNACDNASAVACCVKSLIDTQPTIPFEIIIADNGSHDLLPLLTPRWKGIKYISKNGGTFNQASVLNHAVAEAIGTFFAFLDGSCETFPGWDMELLGTLDREPTAFMTGGKILTITGTLQHGGGLAWRDGSLTVYGKNDDPNHPRYNHCRPVDYVSSEFMMIRSDVFLRLQGFDSSFAVLDYAVADLACRARQYGWKTLYQPMAKSVRYSMDLEFQNQTNDANIFRERWAEKLFDRPENGGCYSRGVVGHALFVDQGTPTPDQDSGSIDQVNLLKILIDLGWRVSFVPEFKMEYRDKYTADIQRIGVQCIYTPYYQNLWEFVRDEGENIDLAILYKGNPAVHYYNVIEQFCSKAKFILDTVDIHFLREMREAELLRDEEKMTQALHTKSRELEAIRLCDCTIILSDVEEKIIREEVPDANLAILPLIRSIPGPQAPLSELRDVCFIGGFFHHPNRDAVHYFVKNIWPLVEERLPNVRFRIMGSNVPPDIQALHGGSVVVDGFVPDLNTTFARCRVSVAPLRYGAGLKGKVASSLGFGIPCVASPIAFEGMGSGSNIGVDVASEPRDFAQCIVRLYNDSKYWMKQSKLGLDFVNKEYSLDAIKNRFSKILLDLSLPIRVGSEVGTATSYSRVEKPGRGLTTQLSRSEVSVIIPLYNHEHYIAAALESVFSQTRPPAEVIVIDDGSSDQSYEVATRLCAGFKGARMWKQENRGAHNTINTAIQRATQPVIAILNSDDIYLPYRLERCLAPIKEMGMTVVASDIKFIDAQANSIENAWYKEVIQDWKNIQNTSLALLNGNFLMTTSNLVIHRSVLRDIGFFRDFRYAHDLDFFVRILAFGHKIKWISEPLLKYRYHSTNTISENHAKVRAEWAYICAKALREPSAGLLEGMSSLEYKEKLIEIIQKHNLSQGVLMMLQSFNKLEQPDFSSMTFHEDYYKSILRSLT